MVALELERLLLDVFKDNSLFGFAATNKRLAEKENCKCVLVTLMPYPDLKYMYNAFEFYAMNDTLWREHSHKLGAVKAFLDKHRVKYVLPPATPKDDGEYWADFSYKWVAIHAGLGFIGKNDVFVHYKYAQRIRISCLLIDIEIPVFTGNVESKCENCDVCVKACPYGFISGRTWNINIRREDLIDYKGCASKSKHNGDGQKYLCARCALSCTYPNHIV